jgi:hypothetical protein
MARTLLTALSDEALVSKLQTLVQKHNRTDAELIRAIGEVDHRRLYRDHACSSMFVYCTQRLGLSEDAAYRRIRVAREARKLPGILDHLEAGHIHLTGLSLLCPHLTRANANGLLRRARGKTKRQVQELVAALAPRADVPASIRKVPAPRRSQLVPEPVVASPTTEPKGGRQAPPSPQLVPEPVANAKSSDSGVLRLVPPSPVTVEPLSGQRYHIHFTAGAVLKKKLDQAMELSPVGTGLEAVIESAVSAYVDTLRNKRFGVAGRKRRPVKNPGSRYITKAIKREVFERDGGVCTFEDAQGHRCTERKGLEYDHIVPHARGGPGTVDNLRLRCRAHNQLHAEACFGAQRQRWATPPPPD